MKIAKKLDYACRVLLQLARKHDSGQLSQLEELAHAEDISANFLVQILTDLRRAGLVESRRGKEGGYLLSCSPATLTLYDVILLFEGSLLEYDSQSHGQSSPLLIPAWQELETSLRQKAQTISFASLLEKENGPMFFI